MGLEIRTSSTSVLGTANAVSLGGYISATAPSETKHAFFDAVTAGQNDTGYTDYRCLFIWNNSANTYSDVRAIISNKGGGASGEVALDNAATADKDSLSTQVIGSETTAPTISGSWNGLYVTIGTLAPDQAKAVWIKRTVAQYATVTYNDTISLTASGTEG